MAKVINTSDPQTENIVSADEWQQMSVNELYEQKIILQNRIFATSQMKNRNITVQLQRGMIQLEAIIKIKSKGETTII